MISLIIATTTERKTVLVPASATFGEVIDNYGYGTVGMTYHFNGVPVDRDTTVSAGTLVAVPAQKAGC